MRSILGWLQPLGGALLLPIAALPIAGLLLRLGQPDLLNLPFSAAAGDAIFSNLGLLFAIGVAVGLAKDNNGAAGLAGAICFLIASKGAIALLVPPADLLKNVPAAFQALVSDNFKTEQIARSSVPMGLISGIIAGYAYNRFHALKLPEYLAFFGGRRSVPIIYFVNGCAPYLDDYASSGADVLGVDWRVGIDEVRRRVGDGVALQGNLDPGALFASPGEIRTRVADILARAGSVGHIFNLGHGVLPETDPEHVRAMVTAVKELSARV